MLINKKIINTLNIGGRGGKESVLLPLLPEYERTSAPLYDFVSSHDPSDRIETKKQANCQWFDIGKYYNLSSAECQIKMMFLIHDKGSINLIFFVSLGKMLDLLCSDPEWQKHGWTADNIKTCSELKESFPSMQVKVKLSVKSFYKKYHNHFETVYVRP